MTLNDVNILLLLCKGPEFYGRAYFGEGQGDIYIEYVQCNGNESHLEECPSSDVGDHDCSHSVDAGVSCKGTGSIRLLCLYARSLSLWIISETNHYMIFYMGLNQTTLGMIQF